MTPKIGNRGRIIIVGLALAAIVIGLMPPKMMSKDNPKENKVTLNKLTPEEERVILNK